MRRGVGQQDIQNRTEHMNGLIICSVSVSCSQMCRAPPPYYCMDMGMVEVETPGKKWASRK